MEQDVRATYGASLSPDATAFAHIVDDGGYPRAVQRFLRGWRASSSRDVELPVEGPVTRVIHSADGHWLACQVAPDGSTRSQIWVVTTDPDDRMARRIDGMGSDGMAGTAELIAWAGSALIRVGPRGYRELIVRTGLTEIALLPSDPGSNTDMGVLLDDHNPRRLRSGPVGEDTTLYHPAYTYGPVSARPSLHTVTARDGRSLFGWLYCPPPGVEQAGMMIYLHGGPEGQARPSHSEIFPGLLDERIAVFAPNVRGSGGRGREFVHADDKEKRFGAIDDVADCAHYLAASGFADPCRIACAGWSYGGYLTMAALTFHPDLFVAGISICGMSDLGTFYRNTEPWIAAASYPEYGHPIADRDLLDALSPLQRVDSLVAPLLVVHGGTDTNVPVSESEQIVEALRLRGRVVRYLLFEDDGHEIVKRENHAALARAVADWLAAAFDRPEV